jgi:hypothetical protein
LSGGVYQVKVLALDQRTRPLGTPPPGVAVVVVTLQPLHSCPQYREPTVRRQGISANRLLNDCQLVKRNPSNGKGGLFGLALARDGKGFYFVEDDMKTLVKATR